MAVVSCEKIEKLIPEEQMIVLEKMKKDVGVEKILKQWKISRGTYKGVLSFIQAARLIHFKSN